MDRPLEEYEAIYAVIRNPYELQVSMWLYWKDRYARGMQGLLQHAVAASAPDLMTWLQNPFCDWHVWDVRDGRTYAPLGTGGYSHFGGFYPYWLGGADGRIPENVQLIDFHQLSEAAKKHLDIDVPRLNVGNQVAWQEYMSPVAAALIEQKFSWAFSHIYPRMYDIPDS